MRTITVGALLLLLILAIPRELEAQYWGERVLEKTFEQTDFFFVPSTLSPYGIGTFKSTTPGLLKDPLLDVIINPALLAIDSARSVFLYTDLRSAHQVKNDATVSPQPWLAYTDRMMPDLSYYYPSLYITSRRELEPVFTGAVIARPLPSAVQDLIVGATYQMVLQDEKYYDIPQDIYRSAIGYDYNGMRAAAQSSIPIVDRYSGKDNMHQAGNFITGFVRYALPEGTEVGLKLSRVIFNRNGSFGSSNLWQYSPSTSGTSLWSSLESRDQSYSHWEMAGGLERRLSDQFKVGLSAGYLWGTATQALRSNDSSYYSYSSVPNTSLYLNSGNTAQEWRQKGRNWYYGVDVSTDISPGYTLTGYYQHQRTNVDIGLGSGILDTSYSTYTWTNNGTPVTSTSHSSLSDVRAGSGTQDMTTDRVVASLRWAVDARVGLSIGALVEWQETKTNTSEGVLVAGGSAYQASDGSWNQQYGQGESKDLLWTFTAKRTSFQVPVFVTIRATDALEVLFGLNRTMTQWAVDDVTLALFRYRMSMNNGTVQIDRNFGERYTEPPENVSDVRTTFLAGLTVTPSPALKLRLLMVPNFKDTIQGSELEQFQWWIGVTVMP